MTEFVLCLSVAEEALSLHFADLAVGVFECRAVGFTCCRGPITSSFFMLDGPVMFTSCASFLDDPNQPSTTRTFEYKSSSLAPKIIIEKKFQTHAWLVSIKEQFFVESKK